MTTKHTFPQERQLWVPKTVVEHRKCSIIIHLTINSTDNSIKLIRSLRHYYDVGTTLAPIGDIRLTSQARKHINSSYSISTQICRFDLRHKGSQTFNLRHEHLKMTI